MGKGNDKIKMPVGQIRSSVDGNSFNKESNTIEVVFATETPVLRYDWLRDKKFNEVLDISDKAIDFSRLHAGASVLNSHNRFDLGSVIGVVESASADISKKEARAKIRLSKEEADRTVVNKIRDGIIRNISVGYKVNEYRITEKENSEELPEYRAVRWQPAEISFVSVPADYTSGVRKEEKQEFHTAKILNPTIMDVKNRKQETTPTKKEEKKETTPTVDESKVRAEAIQAERKRVADITDVCQRAGLDNGFTKSLIEEGGDLNEASAAIIDEVAKRATPAPTNQGAKITGEDEYDQIREAALDGILERANPGTVKDIQKNEKSVKFRNMRLLDIAKDRLRANGEKYGLLDEQEIVKRAWSTTDFPKLLSTAFDRSLRRYYEAETDPWKFIARQESASDFKEKTGIKVDGSVSFDEIPKGGTYKASPILQADDAKIKLKKYGRKYSITDIAIINDDLSVFSRMPQIMALGALQFQSKEVWDNIISNKKAPDTKPLFDKTNHSNYDSTGATISETSLSAGRTAMRRQTSPAGNRLGIKPKYLIVPPELQTAAEKMVVAITASDTSNVNVFANALQVIVADQLTDAKAWYLAADPNAISADGIVYAYLNGQPGLRTENRVNWDTDALEVKASMAFATAVWGYEGWYKNKGA